MSAYRMLINGQLKNGESGDLPVTNPANELEIASAPIASKAQLDCAVKAARSSQPGWAALSLSQRSACIKQVIEVMLGDSQRLTKLLVTETGKPLALAQFELDLARQFLQQAADSNLPVELLADSPENRIVLKYRPLGVSAAIVPWNFPLLIGMIKLGAALMSGCTVVLKPSPQAPLTLLHLGALLSETVPAGVLNIISGDDELGPWLTSHQGVDKISFTGSTATGQAILAQAASDVKRVTLELGGNDAAIVLPNADIGAIAESIFTSSFVNSGQACVGIKRLYVHESLYEPMLGALGQIASHVQVGNGMEDTTVLGPIQNEQQYQEVLSTLEQVEASDARIICGGSALPRPGYFISPTVVADVSEGCPLVDEETFGPVLPVISYTDIEEVILRANETSYGLGGSVWGSDVEQATEIAERLECGTAWVNQHAALDPRAPISGTKWSGLGVESGMDCLKEFCRPQVTNIMISPQGATE